MLLTFTNLGLLLMFYDETIARGNNFGSRSIQQYLIGFTPTGYKTYNPITKKITPVCSVEIHEDHTYKTDFPSSYKVETLQFISLNTGENISTTASGTQHDTLNTSSSNRDIHELEEDNESFEQTIDYDWDSVIFMSRTMLNHPPLKRPFIMIGIHNLYPLRLNRVNYLRPLNPN